MITLEDFKGFLEKGTHDGQEYQYLDTPRPLSRYYSMRFAFEWFRAHAGKTIVELGTIRSYVGGGHPGCNTDDKSLWDFNKPEGWDWGGGMFSLLCAMCLEDLSPRIITVDIQAQHIERCKHMTIRYDRFFEYHVMNSVDYLKQCPYAIDLLYVDTGDMWPIEPTAALQMQEAREIVSRELLSKSGVMLIDDVRNCTPYKFGETAPLGKSKYSVPFLEKEGYKRLIDEYQVVMAKK